MIEVENTDVNIVRNLIPMRNHMPASAYGLKAISDWFKNTSFGYPIFWANSAPFHVYWTLETFEFFGKWNVNTNFRKDHTLPCRNYLVMHNLAIQRTAKSIQIVNQVSNSKAYWSCWKVCLSLAHPFLRSLTQKRIIFSLITIEKWICIMKCYLSNETQARSWKCD